MWSPLLWLYKNHIKVLLTLPLSVKRKQHRKDQNTILKDKHDSSFLQASLWRNDELSEYQQESQLSITQVSILQAHIVKWAEYIDNYAI